MFENLSQILYYSGSITYIFVVPFLRLLTILFMSFSTYKILKARKENYIIIWIVAIFFAPFITRIVYEICRRWIYKKENVKILCGKTVVSYDGESELEGITIRDEKTSETQSLKVDGVFVAIGLAPQNEPFKNVIDLDSYGYADSLEDCTTKTEGIFVAGDCRKKRIRQLTTACADGSVSALAAVSYIESL